ncbi:TBP-associated factor 8 [Oratosquilla oratoria]|uniref:TBP-associated factor 8 n=1 Tax=Oratosquilla oratoria TaxID=337810 RepID=UPI003F765454
MAAPLQEQSAPVNPRRKCLAAVVGAVIQETGFHGAQKAAIGTLTEILQSLLYEIGRSSRSYCEIAYRSEPVVADVILALTDLGLPLIGLQTYSKRLSRVMITPPAPQVELKQHNVLQVGDKKSHPTHIPDHLPAFPDTHTYHFSHTYKQPVTEYEAIREKAATQKKDIDKALTKFAVKTSDTQSLFITEDKEFLLVAVKPNPKPFYDALCPRDQVFEEEEHTTHRRRRKMDSDDGNDQDRERLNDSQDQEMENPYLRPVKMPRKTKSKK